MREIRIFCEFYQTIQNFLDFHLVQQALLFFSKNAGNDKFPASPTEFLFVSLE